GRRCLDNPRRAGGTGVATVARIGNVQVRTYFPTPVVVTRLEEADDLNRELARIILAREATTPGVQHSNLGGWQSADDFQVWGGAPGRALLEAAMSLATRLTADRRGKP